MNSDTRVGVAFGLAVGFCIGLALTQIMLVANPTVPPLALPGGGTLSPSDHMMVAAAVSLATACLLGAIAFGAVTDSNEVAA